MTLVEALLSGNLVEARELLSIKINEIVDEKLEQRKLRLVAEEYNSDMLPEGNIMKMGRMKLIRVRVRKGKVQRRIKKSAVPGFTVRSGKLVRMTPLERRHRKMGARTAKFKRRHELQQSIRKRKVALRRRKALGV